MQRYEKNRFPGNLFTNHWFSTRLGRMQQLFLFLPKIRMSIKKKQPLKVAFLGGETGIRTLGPASWSTVFETAPIDHSGISPCKTASCSINHHFLASVFGVQRYKLFLNCKLFFDFLKKILPYGDDLLILQNVLQRRNRHLKTHCAHRHLNLVKKHK